MALSAPRIGRPSRALVVDGLSSVVDRYGGVAALAGLIGCARRDVSALVAGRYAHPVVAARVEQLMGVGPGGLWPREDPPATGAVGADWRFTPAQLQVLVGYIEARR